MDPKTILVTGRPGCHWVGMEVMINEDDFNPQTMQKVTKGVAKPVTKQESPRVKGRPRVVEDEGAGSGV